MNNIKNDFMILDKCHYQLIKTIKSYNYSENNLMALQSKLKSIIDDAVQILNPMEYNNDYKQITYILVAFCDNLFIIYGPQEIKNLWQQSSMEKVYFNTVTSSYIFYKELSKIIENNTNIPQFLIYSYYLFFESLGQNNEFYKPIIGKFFKENLRKPNINNIKEPINYSYFYYNFFKINLFNLLFIVVFFMIIILGNRYLYWKWLMNNII